MYKYIYAWVNKIVLRDNNRCGIQESVLDETGGMVDFDLGLESTYGFITDRHGLSLFGCL